MALSLAGKIITIIYLLFGFIGVIITAIIWWGGYAWTAFFVMLAAIGMLVLSLGFVFIHSFKKPILLIGGGIFFFVFGLLTFILIISLNNISFCGSMWKVSGINSTYDFLECYKNDLDVAKVNCEDANNSSDKYDYLKNEMVSAAHLCDYPDVNKSDISHIHKGFFIFIYVMLGLLEFAGAAYLGYYGYILKKKSTNNSSSNDVE